MFGTWPRSMCASLRGPTWSGGSPEIAAAVAGEHLGPEPRGLLVGRDGLGGQRALHELVDRGRAVGRGDTPDPGARRRPGRRRTRDRAIGRYARLLGDRSGYRVPVGPVQRPEQAPARLGQADLLGPVELLAVAADGLDQAGRVGGHPDRGGDGDPGQVDLHHDAVFGLAVAERHRDGLVVTEHVVAAPRLAGRHLADLGHPVRRVDARAGQFGQRPAGRPLGVLRAERHEQPEQRRAVRRCGGGPPRPPARWR